MLSKFLNGRAVQNLSLEDLVQLVKENSVADRNEDPVSAARRNYQLQLLLSKLPVEKLAELSAEMIANDDSRNGQAYKVFGAWARRDWAGALEWAENTPANSQWVGSALGALAATDPDLAAKLVSQKLMDGRISERSIFSAVYSVAQEQAKLGKDSLLRFVDSLPASHQSNVFSNTLRDLPKEDLPAMVDELFDRSQNKKIQDWSFNSAMSEFMRKDPEKARQWIDALPAGEQRTKVETDLAQSLAASGKTAEALELMKSAIAGSPGKEKEAVVKMATQNRYGTSENLPDLVKLLPPGVEITADDYKNSDQFFGWGQSGMLVDLAKTIQRPEEKAKLLTQSLEKATEQFNSRGNFMFNEVDFQLFENRVASLGLTGDAADQVNASIRKAREAMANPTGKRPQQ
jgi:hypothetical protein